MSSQIYDKLRKIEREVWGLKLSLLKSGRIANDKKPISLEGIFGNIDITEEEIEISKKLLFPKYKDM